VSESESTTNGLGRILKFNGKEGKLVFSDGADVSAGAVYIVTDVRVSWVKFNDEGTAPERVGDSLLSPNYKPRTRESLGDTDRAEWDYGKFSNLPEDPWQGEIVLILRVRATGEACSFVALSRSKSAMSAAKAVAQNIKTFCLTNPDKLPIVRLSVGSYKHKKFGKIAKPAFEIAGSIARTEVPDAAEPLFAF
jgi:hypothetical protein